MTRARTRKFVGGLLVALPACASAFSLTAAWPFMWADALARPLVALGQHGDPLLALGALAGTLETLTVWAWRDAPLLVACAALQAALSVWVFCSLFARVHAEEMLARLVVRLNEPLVDVRADGGDRRP
jgi:hypothetical protein